MGSVDDHLFRSPRLVRVSRSSRSCVRYELLGKVGNAWGFFVHCSHMLAPFWGEEGLVIDNLAAKRCAVLWAMTMSAVLIGSQPKAQAAPVPIGRFSFVTAAGAANDIFGPGIAYDDDAMDAMLGTHFVETVMGASTSPSGDHVLSSEGIQDSELLLGTDPFFPVTLLGGHAAGLATARHEIFGLIGGGGFANGGSVFEVTFAIPAGDIFDQFNLGGTYEAHGDAIATVSLDKTGPGGGNIFSDTAEDGAFTYNATALLLPGTYKLRFEAFADAIPGASSAEFDFVFSIPEPSTLILGLLGLVGLPLLRRRGRTHGTASTR